MASYYLKATNKNSLWNALEAAGLAHKQYDPDDPLNQPSGPEGSFTKTGSFEWLLERKVSLDEIGTIYVETGQVVTNADGSSYQEVEAVDGYHANLIAVLTSEQEAALPVIPAPTTPKVKWAGEV